MSNLVLSAGVRRLDGLLERLPGVADLIAKRGCRDLDWADLTKAFTHAA
jgi:hypothetical protein